MATRSAEQNNLIKLYLAAFLRAPEYSGYAYWADQLGAGKTIQQVAWNIFSLEGVLAIYPDSISGTEFVNRIYRNVFGKQGDAEGISYWRSLLTQGSTRGELVLNMINAGLNTPDSTPGKAYIANRYTAAQYAVEQQQTLLGEITPDALLAAMATVSQVPQTLTTYSNQVRQLALAAAGKGFTYFSDTFNESTVNDGSITETITIRLSGDTFKGTTGDKLGTVSKTPAGLTASLTKASDVTALLTLTGKANLHTDASSIENLTVTFAGTDLASGTTENLAGAVRNNLKVTFHDLFVKETNGLISGEGALPGALLIDLASDKLSLSSLTKSLSSGALANAHNIDLSTMAPPPSTDTKTTSGSKTTTAVSATLQGDGLANSLTASTYGDTLEGRGGNDVLKGGAGVDRFILAGSAGSNGVDTLVGFTSGAGGDILNVKAFLDKTGTANIATVVAADPSLIVATPKAWTNGNVLVAQGNWLNANTDIVNLFGVGHAYAAPTVAAKLVLITSDIVGDAKVWYITNQTDLANITADEIQQVANLDGIHNLTLVGFAAANFA